MSMEGGGSGPPDTKVELSGGVVDLIQRNTDEGSSENLSAMLTKPALLLLFYPAAQVLWFSYCCVWHLCATDHV